MAYNIYHTNLIIASKYGLLDQHVKATIPASTRSEWKKKDVSRIIGYGDDRTPPDLERMIRGFVLRKGFRNVCRGLYAVNEVLRGVVLGVKDRKKVLKEHTGRIASVMDSFGKKIGKERILKWFGVPYQQLAYWKSLLIHCPLSPLGWCRVRHPHQLLPFEVKRLKAYLKDPVTQHWPLVSIYHRILRDKAVDLSKGAFYKYVQLLGVKRPFSQKPNKRRSTGIRAFVPFEIRHMDVSIFQPMDHTKVYLYLVVDNFSRAVLSWRASLEYKASICLSNLKEALDRARRSGYEREKTLVVDDGCSFFL